MSGEKSGGRLALIECEGVRGDAAPLHVHANEDEILYVLEGELTVSLGDEELSALAGSALYLPRDREHSCVVESEGARLLLGISPAGFEGLLEELGWGEQNGHEIERLVGVAARYGVDFTGPPPERRRADQ